MCNTMFCFQCEQTAGCKSCTGAAGVCGKKADTEKLQDDLTGALIGLARATFGNEHLVEEETHRLVGEVNLKCMELLDRANTETTAILFPPKSA